MSEPVGVVDCAKACADLAAAVQLLSRRLAEAAAAARAGGRLDPGHANAIRQAKAQVEDALANVEKYCGTYVGAAILVEAARAVIEAAEAVLAASAL